MRIKLILIIIMQVVCLQILAKDREIFRCISGNDTTSVYINEMIWITKSEFKLSKESSDRLKRIDPSNPTFKMFYLSSNLEWVRIHLQIKGAAYSATFRPKCIIWMENGIFQEKDDIFRYRGKGLYSTIKELVNKS